MPWKPQDPLWWQGAPSGRTAGSSVRVFRVHTGVPAADARKLQYALDSNNGEDPFLSEGQLETTVTEVCGVCLPCKNKVTFSNVHIV